MSDTQQARLAPLMVMIVVVALAGVGFIVAKMAHFTDQSDRYRFELPTTPALADLPSTYSEQPSIDLPFRHVDAIATGPGDQIYVAGDESVLVLDSMGQTEGLIDIGQSVNCLAIGHSDSSLRERLLIATESDLLVYSVAGERQNAWPIDGESPWITSISASPRFVYAADAANRVVCQFDLQGNLIRRWGEPSETDLSPPFIVPSDHFDLVAGENGLVHVVNPGARQIRTYAENGTLELSWGRAGADWEGFFGCCNPTHLAMLPDGRFVTSEKGLPRIKIYQGDGKLEAVVANRTELLDRQRAALDTSLSTTPVIYDIAVDSSGRVLVLDPVARQIRIFTSNQEVQTR